MKKIILLILTFIAIKLNAQVYNPAQAGISVNKPIGIAQGVPTDARSWYYNAVNFTYRKFASTAEAIAYLNTVAKRSGNYPIWLSIGGKDKLYMFRDGTADINLTEIILYSPSDTLRIYNSIVSAETIRTTIGLQQVSDNGSITTTPVTLRDVFIRPNIIGPGVGGGLIGQSTAYLNITGQSYNGSSWVEGGIKLLATNIQALNLNIYDDSVVIASLISDTLNMVASTSQGRLLTRPYPISGDSARIIFSSIEDMKNYLGHSKAVFVTDTILGGPFYIDQDGLTPDENYIYEGETGNWRREYETDVLDFSQTRTYVIGDTLISLINGQFYKTVVPSVLTTGSYADPSWVTSLAWSKVIKTGSSLADLITRSAGDLSSGTLSDARLSSNVIFITGTQTLTGDKTFSGIINVPVQLISDSSDKAASTKTVKQIIAGIAGGGSYTDEQAQDAVGTMVANSSKINLNYVDATPSLTATIVSNSLVNADINTSAAIDATKLADGSITSTELQYINTLSSNAQTQLDTKAPLASPTFTGVPIAPTAAANTNTTQVATTAHVFAERTNSATLTNKTLTAPVISTITNTGTLTLPIVTSSVSNYKTSSTTSSAAPAPTGDAKENLYQLTALATAPTFAAPSGTVGDGNTLLIRITSDATPRVLTWNAIYRGGGVIALPSTTTASKTMYVQFIYNSLATKWDLVGITDLL